MRTNTAKHLANIVNGVDVDQVNDVNGAIQQDTKFAAFQFRDRNKWLNGSLNRSYFEGYTGANQENKHPQTFELVNDEPELLDGDGSALNPVEYLLHALAGCLTTTLVYHAAVRGIKIEQCESALEGDIDLRGLFGLSDEVRKGYQTIRVVINVKSEASNATLKELAQFSPVYDIVSRSVPVELSLQKN